MIALIRKEINGFFAGPMGYLVIAIFLVINGLILWIFAGDYNIFDAGFADLSAFFELAPWVLLFLIPAVTMRAFSDEKKTGTLELLLTKPISLPKIIFGKYLGAVLLIGMALLPTVLYVFTISDLGNPQGNWDVGSTVGSYIGLLLLSCTYAAVGIFASTLSKNQIVAFIAAVFICFVLYFGFEGASSVSSSLDFSYFGIKSHYNNSARGVIDTRDLLYFVSVILLFLVGTFVKIKEIASQ